MFSKLIEYSQQTFVQNAFIVGTLVALCSALLGVPLVLKRFSFIGDGLSHVAFGAMTVATVLRIKNDMIVILPVTVICAIILLAGGRGRKIKGDAAVAMISVGALAFGYLLMSKFSGSGNISGDVCSTLFGSTSILTLSKTDVILCVVLSILVTLVFVLFFNRIFSVTFDESFAEATGTRASLYNLLVAVITAVIIVLAMNLVGSLLISALIVFPALAAMRVFRNFRAVTICAAVFSVVCAILGLSFAVMFDTPVGSTIVAADVAGLILFTIIGKIRRSAA